MTMPVQCRSYTRKGNSCPLGATYISPRGPQCHVHADRLVDVKLRSAPVPPTPPKPGDVFHGDQQRARSYSRRMRLDGSATSWEAVALALAEPDPAASRAAYSIGAIAAGSVQDWATGNRLAHASGPLDGNRTTPYDAAMATAAEPAPEPPRSKRASVASKTKHTCPGCGANVWGKPSTLVECVACRRVLQAAS